MQELADYIRAQARATALALPCAPFVCDWIVARTEIDPIADLRGRSSSTIRRRIKAEGGFEAMARARLGTAGLVETIAPIAGDVGIVLGRWGQTLAIRMAGGWAGKAPGRGVTIGQFDLVAAWSVPCLR